MLPSNMPGSQYLLGVSGKQALVVGATVTVIGINVYRYVSHILRERDEAEWELVGKLSHLMCYPIKSCAPVTLNHSDCSILGLKKELLRDRTFMVVNYLGDFVTGRTNPKMVRIHPQIIGPRLILKADGMAETSVSVFDLLNQPTMKKSIWGELVDVVDCGDEVAAWLTKFLQGGLDPGLRLVFFPSSKPARAVRPKNKQFKCTERDVGALADATSYNLVTLASLEELNSRLEDHVDVLQFRPNFVVEGGQPYAEDDWDWVRIGKVVFQNVKPCTRCVFTTVDPFTGLKSGKVEPLATLKSYRKMMDIFKKPSTDETPVFGIHLAIHKPLGTITVGDEVYIKKVKKNVGLVGSICAFFGY